MKKTTLFMRFTACLLIVTCLFTSIDFEFVFAKSSDVNVEALDKTISTSKNKPKKIKELKKKRDKFSKVYLMSDGTYSTVISSHAVHYKNNNEWINVNNSLEEIEDSSGIKKIKNKKNYFDVEFSNNINDYSVVNIKKGKYEINWGLQTDSKDMVDIKKSTKKHSEVQYKLNQNVDIKYELLSEQIKESIILNERQDDVRFTFVINHKNLFISEEDGFYVFRDKKGEFAFKMQKFFMYDAKNVYSNEIETVINTNNSKTFLTIIPSEQWLNDSKREYPVVIDPIISTSQNEYNLQGVLVATNSADVNCGNMSIYLIEYLNYIKARGYYKLNNLPIFDKNQVITSAQATFTVNGRINSGTTTNISLNELGSSFDVSQITWNNKPEGIGVVDYVEFTETNDYSFDITGLVKKWYDSGVNTGFMIKKEPDGNGDSFGITSIGSVTINWMDASGIEDYMSYQTSQIGRAGEGSVNYFTGGLTLVHNDVATRGLRMPVSVNHVYNGNGTDKTFGIGWKINFDQKVTFISSDLENTAYYKWTDGDGTEHYFIRTEESDGGDRVWKCEEIPDYSLSVLADGNSIKIYDKQNTVMLFNKTTGYLYEIYDAQETESSTRTNKIEITRSDETGYITEITDAANKSIQFVYENNKLISIVDNSHIVKKEASNEKEAARIIYGYTNDKLTSITYPDNKGITYQYDDQNRLIKATDIDGYSVEYDYTGEKVRKVTQRSSTNEVGQFVLFDYNLGSTRITDNLNNWSEIVFNHYGIVTSVYDSEGYTTNTTYDITANSTSKFKVLSASNAKKSIINLSRFGNIEQYGSWYINKNDTLGGVGYDWDYAYKGEMSLRLEKRSSVREEYVRIYQNITLEKDKTYTASLFFYGKDTYNPNVSGNDCTPWVNVNGTMFRGNKLVKKGEWTRLSVTFDTSTLASQTGTCKIGAELIGDYSDVIVDCLQVEQGESVNDYNILDNSDFSYVDETDNTKAQFWQGDASIITLGANEVINGCDNKAVLVQGSFNENKELSQSVKTIGNQGDYFYFGGFYKGESNRNVTIEVQFLNKETNTFETGDEVIEFLKGNPNWQHESKTVEAPCDFNEVKIVVKSNGNTKSFKIDALYVISGKNTVDITYDENGNLETEIDETGVEVAYDINGNNDLESTTKNGNVTAMSYDDNHNNTSVTDPDLVRYESKYDDYGNVIESSTRAESTSGPYIMTQSEYSTCPPESTEHKNVVGNYITKEKDERGKSIQYDYDSKSGLLNSVTDAKGNTTKFTYDDKTQAITKMELDSNPNVKSEYLYENDKLSAITTSTSAYSFVYDAFGNNTEVNIGTSTLVENTFNISTGNLSKVEFGNGDYIEHTYDNSSRVKTTKVNGVEKFRYFYNANGNLGSFKDLENNVDYTYQYDFSGRLVRSEDSKGNAFWMKYDDESSTPKTEKFSYFADSKEIFKGTNILNESGNLKIDEFEFPNGTMYSKSFEYDVLGRNTKTILGVKTGGSISNAYSTSYNYLNVTDNRTTNFISSIQFKKNDEILKDNIAYEYDNNGNISKIIKRETATSNPVTIEYFYDELNQLKRENNPELGGTGQTVIYNYDNGGNLLSKDFYSLQTGNNAPTGEKTVKNYVYGDSNWKDKLSSYNGQAITYDEVGNPINYMGKQFVWTRGRMLKRYTQNAANNIYFDYKYNDEGIRTSKILTLGVLSQEQTTEYNLSGSSVVRDVFKVINDGNLVHTDEMTYQHDGNGELVGFRYRALNNLNEVTTNKWYFYKKNLQGDIIGILDEQGNEVVTYTYDSWGKLLSTTGTEASGIGNMNDYLYRGYRYDRELGFYYLQSRYYDPETGRFLNADVMLDTETVLGFNLFTYCGNNSIMYVDLIGYGRTYVIYYNNPGSGFYDQAMNSPYYNRKSKNVYMISVTSNQDFIDAWNSMRGTIDYVYLYLHGGKGVLYFKGESISFSGKQSFSSLNSKKVKKGVYLFSCKGGAGSEGNNVAWMFAKLSSSKVYAFTGSVSYSKIFGKYYARKAWDWGIIKTFYYQKRYIFWGANIAKSAPGQW